MDFLKKLFGKEKAAPSNEENQAQTEQPCTSEHELIERYGGVALGKQLKLGEIIGENDWNVDMTKQEISFGGDLVFPIQVLGTFSHSSETFLWSWANEQSGLAETIMQQALQLKKYGEENGIDLLRNNEFDATLHDLHLIGLIASGMFNTSGYYLGDYGAGTMVLTVETALVNKQEKDDHLRILTVFPQLISQFEMNHKNALSSYLKASNYTVTTTENSITATKADKTITAEFDTLFRLTSLKG